jgi:hypothetical protein
MVCLVGLNHVLLCASDDRCDGEEERSEEKTFTFVGDRGLEGSSVLGEPKDHGHRNGSEQDEVEDVEDSADSDETGEGVWLDGDESTETSSSHSQGVVGPSVVLDSFSKGKIRLVGVLPSRNFGVLVPARVPVVMLVLLLFEIDVVHLRVWYRISERVLLPWLLCFVVDRISIGINWTRKVATVRRVQRSWSLNPCVRPSSLVRL